MKLASKIYYVLSHRQRASSVDFSQNFGIRNALTRSRGVCWDRRAALQ